MATIGATTTIDATATTETESASHPLYLHPSDHPGQVLVSAVFNGDNFNQWKRSMSLPLSANNKLGFVSGKFKIPGESSME